MVNPFTLKSKISRIEHELLQPLYGQVTDFRHEWLLAETGRIIAKHRRFMEELCSSSLVAAVFKVVKLLGGADRLSSRDFERFTGYVNSGGLQAMTRMLVSVEKEKSFIQELKRLPRPVQQNAQAMLDKSRLLHDDFIRGYFRRTFGSIEAAPARLQENFKASDKFIERLAQLAGKNIKA
jgi:hypothetical protein